MKAAVRLDKFLADAGTGTRSEVKKYIKKGLVQVNGITVKSPEQKVVPGKDQVSFMEKSIEAVPEFAYFLLHKPAGCVSATEDEREKTVMAYVPSSRKGLFPVGRLDKDTEGLLLITDDGALAHRLLSPKHHVEKTYYVKTEGIVTKEDADAIAKGVDIGDEKPALPGRIKILKTDEREGKSEVLITIYEGRFHQVKRMMQAVGKQVCYLKRISMGPLRLPKDLKKGECRPLNEEELKELRAYTGL